MSTLVGGRRGPGRQAAWAAGLGGLDTATRRQSTGAGFFGLGLLGVAGHCNMSCPDEGSREMALLIHTYDLPPTERLEGYSQKAKEWTALILKQPGVREFRAYRNPLKATPEVMVHIEFDGLQSLLAWAESDDSATVAAGMRAAGCTNFTGQMWGDSPLIPEPLKPSAG